MQYAETDHAFVARLAEHWGISIFFEHQSGRDVAVFADDNSGKTTPGLDMAPFHFAWGSAGRLRAERRDRTLPAKYVVDDYNYRTPSVALRKGSIAEARPSR